MTENNNLLSGRYRLGELIGVGGMSDVYRAEDTLLGRQVAIKMMRADLARDENFLSRFRKEAKNAALLNHSAIVGIFDTGETTGPMGPIPFIVMELVQGETLRDIIRREGKLQPRYAAKIMAAVCDALAVSHKAGIIHRDVKPANIMLTNTGTVKVMDFGIARALGDSTAMTQTAAVLGTAQYLSPEQARGKTADGRSDIYAVGCVTYEALTGNPPFTGETPLSVAYQHVQDNPPAPSEAIGDIDLKTAQALDAVVLTAMAKDPMERYDSAADFSADLIRLANGEPPLALVHHAPAPQPSEDTTQTTTFAPQTAVAPTPAPTATPAPEPAAADYEPVAKKKPKKSRAKTAAWGAAALLLLGGGGWGAYQFISSSQSQTVAIPQVEGMSAGQAQQALEDAGFVVTRVDEPNPDIPRDMAIATDPAFGSGLPEGSKITLRVSSGPEVVGVPDVRDKKAEDARRELEKAGFVVDPKLREEPHEQIARGHVIDQSPAAGSQVSKGTRVSLTVSTGLETKAVPDLKGQNLESARATLESAGFVVSVTDVDSTAPKGEVIEVPQAGETLTLGTTVELKVSRGNLIKMPQVNGRKISEAERALRDAGFTGTIKQEKLSTLDVSRVDTVESTNPGANAEFDKDGEITLRIYELGVAPAPAPAPAPAENPLDGIIPGIGR